MMILGEGGGRETGQKTYRRSTKTSRWGDKADKFGYGP